MMFIAMNRFRVQEGRGPDFEAAWKERDSYLAEVPGFLSFHLLKGEGGTYVSHSTWASEAAFEAWTESEAFKKAHSRRLPEGILAGPPQFSGYSVVLSLEAGGAVTAGAEGSAAG
jgi:heme-degrading monooxygenase HmoA